MTLRRTRPSSFAGTPAGQWAQPPCSSYPTGHRRRGGGGADCRSHPVAAQPSSAIALRLVRVLAMAVVAIPQFARLSSARSTRESTSSSSLHSKGRFAGSVAGCVTAGPATSAPWPVRRRLDAARATILSYRDPCS